MTASADLNIVIVTYNWPPRNAIGVHRPYSWAKYWSQAGAKVTVLTARKYAFDAPLDLRLPELSGVDVVEVPWASVSPRLFGLIKRSRIRELAKTLFRKFRAASGADYDVRGRWRRAAKTAAERLAQTADVVVSTYGPEASHLIGFDMKQANPRLAWFADYRDLWTNNPATPLTAVQHHKTEALERATVGACADGIITISAGLANDLQQLLGKAPLVIENGFDIDAAAVIANLERAPPAREGPIRIVYTGLLYKGQRDPEPLLRAILALVAEGRLAPGDLTIDFYGARITVAEELARNPAYAPFIRVIGHVPREQALAAQREADRVLLLESPEAQSSGVLTGKIFEYIASGTPILSLGSPQGTAIWNLIAETGVGICCGTDEAAIKRELLVLKDNRERPAWYRPQVSEILKYSRERQAAEALDFIRERLKRKRLIDTGVVGDAPQ